MKRIFIITVLAICLGMTADAHKRCDNDWKEKIMSEKIAFLTMEMNITPEEAQAFWPVYNQVEQEKDAALEQVIKSYKALSTAVEQNAKTEKLLEAYLEAQKNLRKVDNEAPEKYKAVLSAEKVAKLYVAEEKFRRQHIRKLHGGHKEDKSN
jgi:Spy/CpxP family protein refolding chaperone